MIQKIPRLCTMIIKTNENILWHIQKCEVVDERELKFSLHMLQWTIEIQFTSFSIDSKIPKFLLCFVVLREP